jgi:streptogramin lyase
MRWFLGLALAVALSACSSVGTGPLPTSLTPSHRGASPRAHVSLRIVIPRKHRHSFHYISPATQSIAITVTPFTGRALHFNADLTPATNPNCTPALVCTISFPLAPGPYIASFATYDGPLAGGNGFTNPPTGNELSANDNVPMLLKAGAHTTFKIVLGGVPAGAVVIPYGDNGFTFSKCMSTASVGVYGLDADGNVILGQGEPALALVSSDTTHLAVSQTPSPSAPNTFVLSRPNIPAGGATVNLTATVTPPTLTGAPAANGHATVTFNGDICGVFTHFNIPTAHSLPFLGITAGPDGAVWFTEHDGDNIGRISTAGNITEFTAGSGGDQPTDLVSDGVALWYTEFHSNRIAKITTGGTVTQFSVFSGIGPFGITFGPFNEWFTDELSYQIEGFAETPGGYSQFLAPTPTTNSAPVGIAAGPDGALWFTESNSNSIGRAPPALHPMTEFTIPTHGSEPYAITAGPDGALWFTECSGNNIGRITTTGAVTEFPIPTAASNPLGITVGPDGALWFAEGVANKLGRITTDGTVTEFTITGTTGSGPLGITTGSDRNIWFTESGSNQIGRLQ